MKFKLTKNKAFRLLGILFVFIGIFLFVGDRFDFADPTQGNDISENIVKGLKSTGNLPITISTEYEGKTYTCVFRIP